VIVVMHLTINPSILYHVEEEEKSRIRSPSMAKLPDLPSIGVDQGKNRADTEIWYSDTNTKTETKHESVEGNLFSNELFQICEGRIFYAIVGTRRLLKIYET